ncbi:MAG: extracellular solute-binding protein [Fimbriimonas sp.]
MSIRTVAALFLTLLAACAGAAERVTLRFTVWDGDESLRVIRRVLAQFEAENPDIKVKLENISDYPQYHTKMLVQYAANVAPDVAMMDMPHFQALALRKALLPLNDLIAKTPGFDLNAYYKPIVDAHSLDGRLYVLPRDIAPMGIIYYNKRLFKEAGLPYPDGTWTWDFKERPELKEKDFLWTIRKLTKRNAQGKTSQYGFAPGWPGLFYDTLVYSSGLDYVDDMQRPTKVLYTDPRVVKIYEFINDLSYKQRIVPGQTEISSVLQSTTQQLFARQAVAMYQNGIWEVPKMRDTMKLGSKEFFEWDIVNFPAYAHGDGHPYGPTGGSGYAIFSSTPYPEQAWRLTRYMSGPVAMKAMAEAGIAQPAIRSLAMSEVWLPGPNTPPEQRYPANRLVTDTLVPYVKFGPTAPYWPDVDSIIAPRRDSIFNNLMRPADALRLGNAEGQARVDALLREETLPPFPWPLGIGAGALIVGAILGAVYWPERGIRYTYRERRENVAAYKFLSPWLIGLGIFTLGPMVLSMLMSTMNWDMIRPAQWRGAENYREMFNEDPRFWVSLKVTILYTLIATPLGVLAAFVLALLLNQKVRGVPLFRAMFYIPSIGSAVAITLVSRKILAPEDGLLNSILYSSAFQKWVGNPLSQLVGTPADPVNWLSNDKTAMPAVIMLSLLGAGGAMIVLLAGLQGIPTFYYEAATLDGAGPWHRLKAITLPLLSPALFFSLVTGFIGSFQIFTQVFIITGGPNGGPNNSLLVYMITLYSAAFQNLRMGYAAALAWILFFVIMAFTALQFSMSKWVYYESETKG